MVDAELLGDVDSFETALLADLLDNELLWVFRYADDGPPPSLRPRREDPPVYDGWAVVVNHDPRSGCAVTLPTESGWALSGVIGNATEVARRDDRTGAHADLSFEDNLGAEQFRLSAEELDRLDQASAPAVPDNPYGAQEGQYAHRLL